MKRLGNVLAGLLAVTLILLLPGSSYAASNALAVNPRRDYTVKPGESTKDTLFVQNLDETNDLTVKIDVVDFGPLDESGSPKLILKDTHPTTWSLKPFISIPATYNIKAGQFVNVPFTLSVPANTGGGTFYGAIRYTAVNPATGKNINLASSTVTLMFLTVPGKTHSNLLLQKFGTYTPGANNSPGVYGSFYGSTTPNYIAYQLKNTGNTAEQPKGSVIIKNIFGKTVKTLTDANPDDNIVLIGQTRSISVCLNPQAPPATHSATNPAPEPKCNNFKIWPGRYTAKLSLIYGIQGSTQLTLNGSSSFWYLPAWFIIAVVVVLLIIAGIIWLIVNAIRNARGNRYRTR